MQRVQKVQHAFVIPINVAPAFCVTHVPCRIPYLSGVQVCFVHESVKTAEVRKNIKSAMKNLREDIKRCPELVEELRCHHWNINKHSYSAEEVRLILKYLCQP